MRTLKTLATIAAMLGLAACQPATDEIPTAESAEPGVTLRIEPMPQSECDASAPFAARVQWQVADVDDPLFDLRLHSTQGQLWAKVNTARGERTTDSWASAGMWVVLLDARSQRVLATAQVPALTCP